MTFLSFPRKLQCCIILALGVALVGIFAETIAPFGPNTQNLQLALQAPNLIHWFGTDSYGRDIFSRVLVGTRTSVLATLFLVMLISLTGTIIGGLCGLMGGTIDTVLMRISDVFLAFPGLVFAIAVAGVLGGGITNAVLALAIISWPKYARLVRGQVLVIRERDFVKAARLDGAKGSRLFFYFILPNIIDTILITALLDFGTMLMEIAGLSFLGLGAMPPTAEWGSMMSNGRSMIQTAPWTILAPGMAIFLTVSIFNMLGDTLRDYWEIK